MEIFFSELNGNFSCATKGCVQTLWWAQDGAPPAHRQVAVRNRLAEVFGNQVIAVYHDVEWPPRSPDLTCDIFLWVISRAKCSLPLHLTLQLWDKESLMNLKLYTIKPKWFAELCVRCRKELISVWEGMVAMLRGMGCNVKKSSPKKKTMVSCDY